MPADDVRAKVHEWASQLFRGVELLDSGTIFVPGFGSTALFIEVDDVFEGRHLRVLVDAPVLVDVPLTDDLFQYIGAKSNDFVFGAFTVRMDYDGAQQGILCFRQTLLGDAIDKIELEVATKVVALTADDLDDNLKRRFGGRRFDERG